MDSNKIASEIIKIAKGLISRGDSVELRVYGAKEAIKKLDPDNLQDQRKCELLAIVSRDHLEEMKRGQNIIPELKGYTVKRTTENSYGVEFIPPHEFRNGKSYTQSHWVFPV